MALSSRSSSSSPWAILTTLLTLVTSVAALGSPRLIESRSLNSCQVNSSFTATLFHVIFYPDNKTFDYDFVGVSSVQGNVTFEVDVTAYGISVYKQNLSPCGTQLFGLCPMNTGQIDISSSDPVPENVLSAIPGIAYGVPDLDAKVRVRIHPASDPNIDLACVEAYLSNGKTVYQKGVGWTTAVVAGLALVASAITSGLGHFNTAAHVAANALSLFSYFQAQAIVGFLAVPLPPIVQSWTQNFVWSMGIIRVNFMQTIATWYQSSTGGTPSTLFNEITTTSVQVQKRSLVSRSIDTTVKLLVRAHAQLMKRDEKNNQAGTYVVRGIKRVAFRAGIEATNFFFTGLAFFCIFVVVIIGGVFLFKGICEMSIRAGWMRNDKFETFRKGPMTVLKGIMFRVILIGYPQMVILCLWEFTQVDSPALVVLAVFFFLGMTATLAWAGWKVVAIAKQSTEMHGTPAYTLYSDPSCLNKWGFLYVQYKASAYFFLLPVLIYIVIKGMFVAFAQKSGTAQAIAFILIEGGALIGVALYRPWMDKPVNIFNISIASVNFANAIFLLFFLQNLGLPGIVRGVVGVIFFVVNAIASLVLLILVLVATGYAFIAKKPDTRYQPLADNRGSFIKPSESRTGLPTELDALGKTARGGEKPALDLDDEGSFSSEPKGPSNGSNQSFGQSPVNPAVPLIPANNSTPHLTPGAPGYGPDSRANSGAPLLMAQRSMNTPSPSPYGRPNGSQSDVSSAMSGPPSYRGPSPGPPRSSTPRAQAR